MMETREGIRDMTTTNTGKDCSRKSDEIAMTLIRPSKVVGAVTPGEKISSKGEQQSSKKKREEHK